VELWQQIDAGGRDPLQTATPIATRATPVPAPYPTGGTVAQLREKWIAACLAYDEQEAERAANQAFALYPPETVTVELLQKAVAEIGEKWYKGEVTVQQEHFCSDLVIRRLEALVMASPPPTRPGRILFACPPQEQHVISPLLLTFLLRRRGWEVVYLGANVPTVQLETTTTVTKPQLVISAAQQLHTAATLLEMAQVLKESNVPLAYGGLIFNLLPALRKRIPGHFLGEQLEMAPQAVESLMTAPRPVPAAEEIPEAYLRARDHFESRQGLIEAHVVQALSAAGHAHNHVTLASRELGANIAAALTLGNMDFLGTDIEWVTGLLQNYQLPREALYSYLQAYFETAKEQLDEPAEAVVTWLGGVVKGYAAS
jgi:methanogenic corrinoid protein MtbC1